MAVAPWRRSVRAVAAIFMIVGMVGFIGQGLVASTSVFGPMRGVAWPVGSTSDAIRLPDGRYAVPLRHLDRIQIYSADLRFQYGWHIDAGGGIFTLLSAPGGKLEVYTARGKHHYLFDPDGHLLSSRVYDYKTEHFPDRAHDAVSLMIPSPWWAFPLRGPFYSWATGVLGMLAIAATMTREERAAQRRANAERTNRPSGPVGTAVKTIGSWFAAAVWAVVGVIWFGSTLSLLIRCVITGNVWGAVVSVPFFLIGCFLLFISITIIRVACRELINLLLRRR